MSSTFDGVVEQRSLYDKPANILKMEETNSQAWYLIFVVEISFGVYLVPLSIIVEKTARRNKKHTDLRFFTAKDFDCLKPKLI